VLFIQERILKFTATIVVITCIYLTADMYGEIQRLIKEMAPSMKPYTLLTLYGILIGTSIEWHGLKTIFRSGFKVNWLIITGFFGSV